ncbi:MAG: hypothetical protein OEY07_07335 [Gammaproteobacteria bacterium]|nr:hypothetical protein [Gammaproteobacteria bacterium]
MRRAMTYSCIGIIFCSVSPYCIAMPQCPIGTVSGRPLSAWLVLLFAVITAFVAAYLITGYHRRCEMMWQKINVISAGIIVWVLVMWQGVKGWFHFMFGCF